MGQAPPSAARPPGRAYARPGGRARVRGPAPPNRAVHDNSENALARIFHTPTVMWRTHLRMHKDAFAHATQGDGPKTFIPLPPARDVSNFPFDTSTQATYRFFESPVNGGADEPVPPLAEQTTLRVKWTTGSQL